MRLVKKWLAWVLVGLTATSIAIAVKSNLAILISLGIGLMVPLGIVGYKVIVRNLSYERAQTKPVLELVTNDQELNTRNEYIEKLRTDSVRLQAELARINQIEDKMELLRRKAQWQLKADVYHKMHQEFFENVTEFQSDVKEELNIIKNLREQKD